MFAAGDRKQNIPIEEHHWASLCLLREGCQGFFL
jgi:hypothetical protein